MEYTLPMEEFEGLSNDIARLKAERKAIILAHLYQRPEIQDVADYIGDSLMLAQKAAQTDAEVIVFCGVHFMAESAAILSPEKTVLLPEEKAGCPMADMITAEALRAKKQEHPDAIVVCYVNSSAAVKAESDICCTSSNAVKIASSLPADRPILFVPDQNLGHWVGLQTGRTIIPWEGYCNVHHRITLEDAKNARAAYPGVPMLVHPECNPDVVAQADGVFSTAGIINYARNSDAKEFIIGTECGVVHQLQAQCPGKEFHLVSDKLLCPNMKSTTLGKVKWCLEKMAPRITVSEEVRTKAIHALDKMLELS
ncbi:MAG TPA: quinolinate synthase NadA [Bacillota bacterium]|nr:quinolinate synthase NadA [Bacillota bacterium]